METITVNKGTFRLLKKEPSFADGMAALFDLTPNTLRYNHDRHNEADVNALREDWRVVGNDLWQVLQKYGKSKSNSTTQ